MNEKKTSIVPVVHLQGPGSGNPQAPVLSIAGDIPDLATSPREALRFDRSLPNDECEWTINLEQFAPIKMNFGEESFTIDPRRLFEALKVLSSLKST